MHKPIPKYLYILFFLLTMSLTGCTWNLKSTRTPVLTIGGETLYKDELDGIIPKDANMVDSANIADRYIQKWITTLLMYQNAKRNITNLNEIEKMVADYRASLVVHEYEQALVTQRVDTNVTIEEINHFYQHYQTKLKLDKNVIKGVLLITPKDTPQIDNVRKWIKKGDEKSIEKIKEYSLKNAVSFDYFMDEWKVFSEIIKNVPIEITNTREFILNNDFVEITDSTKHYFLSISKAIPKGETQPLDMAKEKITNIILNKKKSDFIINFESSIYKDALKSGDIEFYNNNK